MRLACISDTHGRISLIKTFPEADILIVAGDACTTGKLTQLKQFVKDMTNWPYEKIIFVAGNHDRCLHNVLYEPAEALLAADPRIIYLKDQAITIDGVKFYGSPWTPKYGYWAFMSPDEVMYENVWRHIPDDTDVLITHGPAYGILDQVGLRNPGSQSLRQRLCELSNLRIHIFGHIHEGRGIEPVAMGDACYTAYNVSMLDGTYMPYDFPNLITLIEV